MTTPAAVPAGAGAAAGHAGELLFGVVALGLAFGGTGTVEIAELPPDPP